MKSIILAAGYATRMYPLTENFPKPLLSVGHSTILDELMDNINNIPEIEEHIIIANHKFFHFFEEWKNKKINTNVYEHKPITILNDGSTDNENRLGAVKDLLFVIEKLNIDDDLLVLAADNLVDFPFSGFADFFKNKHTSLIMYHQEVSISALQKTGVIVIDENSKVLEMAEKPQSPKSNNAVPPFYIYKKDDIPQIKKIIADNDCNIDAPGNLVNKMLEKGISFYAWEMPGKRIDIGDIGMYNSLVASHKKYSGFSILLSIYIKERPEYLKRSLQSIWDDQTLKPAEVIIVKDGPLTPELEAVLSDFAAKAPVKFVANPTNMGLAYALNRGIEVCTCNLIARMDTDDICLPERFARQIAFMEQNPNIDICGTWGVETDENGHEFFKKEMPVSHEECFQFTQKRDCLIHPSVMFRRSYFDKAGLYPEGTYWDQDSIMWGKGFQSGCVFANVPEYLLQFRIGSDFFNRRRGWKRAKSVFLTRRKIIKMLEFGIKADMYVAIFALTKLMPPKLLAFLYKHAR